MNEFKNMGHGSHNIPHISLLCAYFLCGGSSAKCNESRKLVDPCFLAEDPCFLAEKKKKSPLRGKEFSSVWNGKQGVMLYFLWLRHMWYFSAKK